MIPKSELKAGAYYRGTCRNSTIARWSGDFFYILNDGFFEEICHRDDEDRYDVFDASHEISAEEAMKELGGEIIYPKVHEASTDRIFLRNADQLEE